ncbi:MAG: DUF262 domain-containing protein [Peptostreptococcaceae bacterium]|nr:DUF262 domain-containing protein [Peptostreptococcaceae bacterium]
MASGFQTPITIKEAIDNIHNRKYLLPAIQRKFTWNSDQVEMLFDSILRGYPINSFMLWKITEDKIKSDYKFYEFIKEFREFYKENNIDIDTTGAQNFEAVIDGQQRLTSLYLGLRGSFAYKMPRKWWRDDEENLPTRKLYLNLEKPVNQKYDNQKLYDFRFLSTGDLSRFHSSEKKYLWFEVKQILQLDELKKVTRYITEIGLSNNDYAFDTLVSLYGKIHSEKLINYYLQEEQEPDKVLEIFIRTNSGGTPLSFSDLLMSIASANWKKIDARKEIEDLIEKIYLIGRPGFILNKDFILKTCLVLLVDNIKFQVKNFGHENVQVFEDNWEKIKKSIIAGFELIEKLGFNDKTLRAKNAAIPIIYYIYHRNLEASITKATYSKEDKEKIAKWINLSFIKSIFSGQTDSVLVTIRKVLKEDKSKEFPLNGIIDAFKADPARNYSLDDDLIENLLLSQYESNEAFYLLLLLYPHLDYYNQNFHKDHLHPASFFKDRKNVEKQIPVNNWDFALDSNNWNSVLNLQLLNGQLNESKQDKLLSKWVQQNKIGNQELYLEDLKSLEIGDFEEFIQSRRRKLVQKIKSLV